MRPRNEHKRSPCCMVRRGRECARSSKVRQKRAFLLFPERMEKQRRVEKYAFELVFCDCLFCEFPEKSGVKLIGKLVPYHLATPAYIRFALHAKPCGHYSLKHASASEQNENVRESSTHRAQEASSVRSAETRGRSKSLVRRRAGSAAWYQALMQVLPQGKGGRWPSRSLFCSAGAGRCPPSLQTLFS